MISEHGIKQDLVRDKKMRDKKNGSWIKSQYVRKEKNREQIHAMNNNAKYFSYVNN